MGTLDEEGTGGPHEVAPVTDLSPSNSHDAPAPQRRRPPWAWTITALAIILAGCIPLFAWQSQAQQRAFSLANMRRISNGLQMYAQDWDYCLPPPVRELPDGRIVDWPHAVRSYVMPDEVFSSPVNPIVPFDSSIKDPSGKHSINSSYALNKRFWNTFSPGPFPTENLEIPEQTVLLIEAGRMASKARHAEIASAQQKGIGVDTYFDTTDKIGDMFLYPARHNDSLAVVAADGHGVIVRVLYYTRADGGHDTMYGRLGNSVYNWNGGHPNGQIDRPPHE